MEDGGSNETGYAYMQLIGAFAFVMLLVVGGGAVPAPMTTTSVRDMRGWESECDALKLMMLGLKERTVRSQAD